MDFIKIFKYASGQIIVDQNMTDKHDYWQMGFNAGNVYHMGIVSFEEIERTVATLPDYRPAQKTWFSEVTALDAKGQFWKGYYARLDKTKCDSINKEN